MLDPEDTDLVPQTSSNLKDVHDVSGVLWIDCFNRTDSRDGIPSWEPGFSWNLRWFVLDLVGPGSRYVRDVDGGSNS